MIYGHSLHSSIFGQPHYVILATFMNDLCVPGYTYYLIVDFCPRLRNDLYCVEWDVKP